MVTRKPLSNNNGLIEEIGSTDYILVDPISGTSKTGINIINLGNAISDVEKLKFKGSSVSVAENTTGQADIDIDIDNAYGSAYEITPRVYTGSSQNEINIDSFYLILPDGTHFSSTSIITIDIEDSGDRASGVSESSETWYYIYVTNDNDFSNKAFFDTNPPNDSWEHDTLNARYICPVFNNSSSNFWRFEKLDDYIHFLEDQSVLQIWNQTLNSSFSYHDIKKYIPDTVYILLLYAFMSNGNSSILSSLGSKNTVHYGVDYNRYHQLLMILDHNQQLSGNRVTSDGVLNLYLNGFIENLSWSRNFGI